ncbi:hypothetical protein scyTo_0008765 [Scyliorhinus torazame]|uniref:Uncharacterized protein n=1 Tax=Scyliorhinus torazame TaxID=75743 RepID=A0A401PDA8_SCYTO|nr:hypothetical protein [Scyliorhinus torazame]
MTEKLLNSFAKCLGTRPTTETRDLSKHQVDRNHYYRGNLNKRSYDYIVFVWKAEVEPLLIFIPPFEVNIGAKVDLPNAVNLPLAVPGNRSGGGGVGEDDGTASSPQSEAVTNELQELTLQSSAAVSPLSRRRYAHSTRLALLSWPLAQMVDPLLARYLETKT